MRKQSLIAILAILLILVLAGWKYFGGSRVQGTGKIKESGTGSVLKYPEETHFKSIKQLTFGGDNAEAYWSFDDSRLVFQATNEKWGAHCDQIFIYDLNEKYSDPAPPEMVSMGLGRTTCSYFLPGDSLFLYASTHEAGATCPHKPEPREDGKYVWPIYDSYNIYIADLSGNLRKVLTDTPGYDAEATVSPRGDLIVFTSLRSGDLELYTMNIDGRMLSRSRTNWAMMEVLSFPRMVIRSYSGHPGRNQKRK